MIRAVLFDFGGVLSTGGGAGSVQQAVASMYGIAEADVKMDDIHRQLRTGDISLPDFLAELDRRHPGEAKATLEEFQKATDVFAQSPRVYALADALRRAGIRTAMLSNMFEITANELRRRGLYDGFDPLVLSYEVHMAKPDTAIYQLTLDRLGLPAHEVLFIDDQERCLAPAREMGFWVLLAKNPDQIVADTVAIIARENQLQLQLPVG